MALRTFHWGVVGGEAVIGKGVLLEKENGACSSNPFTVSFTALRNLVTRVGL